MLGLNSEELNRAFLALAENNEVNELPQRLQELDPLEWTLLAALLGSLLEESSRASLQ
jgi:hypothetical protein